LGYPVLSLYIPAHSRQRQNTPQQDTAPHRYSNTKTTGFCRKPS
jgi:hypothetical protein